MSYPLVMTEEYWANTQLSVARYYGGINAFGQEYIIVNKDGKDVYECSAIAKREGRTKAIEPGEPCDLVLKRLRWVYRKLGRETFLEKVKSGMSEKDLLELIKKGGLQ